MGFAVDALEPSDVIVVVPVTRSTFVPEPPRSVVDADAISCSAPKPPFAVRSITSSHFVPSVSAFPMLSFTREPYSSYVPDFFTMLFV